MSIIRIETNRLWITNQLENLNSYDVLSKINYEETLKYMVSVNNNYTIEDADMFIKYLNDNQENTSQQQFGIYIKSENTFIGMISLENISYIVRSAEIGFWLSFPYTGKGIAYEAALEIVEYARNILKLEKLVAYVIEDHFKSIALLEKLYFIKNELLINNEENKGKLINRYKFSKNLTTAST